MHITVWCAEDPDDGYNTPLCKSIRSAISDLEKMRWNILGYGDDNVVRYRMHNPNRRIDSLEKRYSPPTSMIQCDVDVMYID